MKEVFDFTPDQKKRYTESLYIALANSLIQAHDIENGVIYINIGIDDAVLHYETRAVGLKNEAQKEINFDPAMLDGLVRDLTETFKDYVRGGLEIYTVNGKIIERRLYAVDEIDGRRVLVLNCRKDFALYRLHSRHLQRRAA
jgi:hypothetical protein